MAFNYCSDYSLCGMSSAETAIRDLAAGCFPAFAGCDRTGRKSVLSSEWFETATNDYKVPENVMQIADLLPENVHVVASNRLTPYLRLRDPSLTLEYARNALVFNGMDVVYGPTANLYKELQKEEIDVNVAGPLAREEKCTFIIISKSHIYNGDWADYGYLSYHDTDEFTILVDENYEEGMDTRKWEE